jgi:hypothetical protein
VTLLVRSMHGYFQSMGIRLLSGRFFDERDESRMEPRVAIVNESFARFYWPGQSAVGKRIAMAGKDGSPRESDGTPVVQAAFATRRTARNSTLVTATRLAFSSRYRRFL